MAARIKKQKLAEYQSYESLKLWEPVSKIVPSKDFCSSVSDPIYPLFEYIYKRTKALYAQLPSRKNGQKPFIHPINVISNLKNAKVDDCVTYCAGLLHDFVEETVDIYRDEHGITQSTKEGIKILDSYEVEVAKQLLEDLKEQCQKYSLDPQIATQIIDCVKLLTRHKRDYYYRSMACIFQSKDSSCKERAIQVKLADRIHNILSIESFDEPTRIYQCFKNMFILNNVKQHLLDSYGVDIFDKSFSTKRLFSSTERLFNRCAKATFDAFLSICQLSSSKGLEEVKPLLQLAFKKFAIEQKGLWEVTVLNPKETHPLRLYQGVVRKYDFRLHHEYEQFDKRVISEKDFVACFFYDYTLNATQIQAVLDYKDAYSLKEVVARMLYEPEYVLSRFLVSNLSSNGRIKLRGAQSKGRN